jgi:hypothetical protein
MKLCVTGKHEIGKLEKMAIEMFSKVEDKSVEVPDLSKPPAYDASNLG